VLDIRKQMASTLLAHGTVVQLSKSNAASKTTAGQWAVCILDKDSALPSLEGTFVVFSEKDEADTYLLYVRACFERLPLALLG